MNLHTRALVFVEELWPRVSAWLAAHGHADITPVVDEDIRQVAVPLQVWDELVAWLHTEYFQVSRIPGDRSGGWVVVPGPERFQAVDPFGVVEP